MKKLLRRLKFHLKHVFYFLYTPVFITRAPFFELYKRVVAGTGLEVGGPSHLFSYEFPLYRFTSDLSFLNYQSDTLWESGLSSSQLTRFNYSQSGHQYIGECTSSHLFNADSFNYILSSNCLEHVANPLLALHTWHKWLKSDGFLVLIVPFYKRSFDRFRRPTPVSHILSDYLNNTTESDTTHIAEVLHLHDIARDPGVPDYETLVTRSRSNLETRGLHHHVFTESSLAWCLRRAGFSPLHVSTHLQNIYSLSKAQ